jgi:hypothetical protein
MTGTASFVVVGPAGSRQVTLSAEANLVSCSRTSPTMHWLRFAESAANNGEDSPHLDIDLCHLPATGGTFAPMEARANPCPGGMTWGAWWHDGPTAVYANRATSAPCELRVEVREMQLIGTFACHGLVTEDGESTIDLVEGRFECTITVPEGTPPPGESA